MFVVRLVIALFAAAIVYGDGDSHSHSDSSSLYSHYNKDGDHCLSLQEFNNIFLDFDTWPYDKQIDREELKAGWRHDHLHDGNDVPFFYHLLDHSQTDNEITVPELTALYNNMFLEHGQTCVSSSRFNFVWNALFNSV